MITLEQVDQVRERTQVSYEQAKAALVQAEGDVLEAIVIIESAENAKETFTKKASSFGDEAHKVIKDILKSGKVNRIVVEKNDATVMNIPVAVGALGALFLTSATIVGLIAALATGCVIKIHKENGEVINVNEEATKAMKKVTGQNAEGPEAGPQADDEKTPEADLNINVEVTQNEDEVVVEVKEDKL